MQNVAWYRYPLRTWMLCITRCKCFDATYNFTWNTIVCAVYFESTTLSNESLTVAAVKGSKSIRSASSQVIIFIRVTANLFPKPPPQYSYQVDSISQNSKANLLIKLIWCPMLINKLPEISVEQMFSSTGIISTEPETFFDGFMSCKYKCKCNSIFTCNVSFLNLMHGWYSLVVTQPSTSHHLVCVHCFVRYLL